MGEEMQSEAQKKAHSHLNWLLEINLLKGNHF